MIYRSNLKAPDIQPHFRHLTARVMPHSFGHTVLSDWADKADDDPVFGLYKNCGLWTHDEAAILYNVARRIGGTWVDIGCHTGWTTAHIAAAGVGVIAVDPMLRLAAWQERFEQNLRSSWTGVYSVRHETSRRYFSRENTPLAGACIDGDHEPGEPLFDAQAAATRMGSNAAIIFHDALGRPVREGAQYLMNRGFKCRWYSTPHGILLCWRGDFTPPDHVSDPNLPDLKARCPDFDFRRCV